MLKVMMNISERDIANSCEWKFKDLSSDDWGCKYAEAALSEWYIAWNEYFRPDDTVTQSEGLKMILQARWIEIPSLEDYEPNTFNYSWIIPKDWRDLYYIAAINNQLIWNGWQYDTVTNRWDTDDYNINAKRWTIFLIASRTYDAFEYDTQNWRLLDATTWIVKYPENWVYKLDWNYASFWAKVPNGLDGFQLILSDESYESLVQANITLPKSEDVQPQDVIDFTTLDWLNGKLYTKIVNNFWCEELTGVAIIQGKNSNYIIRGFWKYLEGFYTTFQE